GEGEGRARVLRGGEAAGHGGGGGAERGDAERLAIAEADDDDAGGGRDPGLDDPARVAGGFGTPERGGDRGLGRELARRLVELLALEVTDDENAAPALVRDSDAVEHAWLLWSGP